MRQLLMLLALFGMFTVGCAGPTDTATDTEAASPADDAAAPAEGSDTTGGDESTDEATE